MALAVDDSVATFRATGSFDANPTTATSAEFTPPAGALIEVSVHAFESLGNHVASSVVSGGGLSWTVAAENGAHFNGGAAGSEGYVAKHWAIADGGAVTVSAVVSHQDNSNAYPISAKARVWTGHDVPPMGLTPVLGPLTAAGPIAEPGGISAALLPDASVAGRLSFAATEHNDGSGANGAPSSTDTAEANFEAFLMATLSGYKAANHAVDDAVSVNLIAAGATKWNVAGLEIPEESAAPTIVGDMDVTDPADTAAVSGGVVVSGSMAVTDAPDTFATGGEVDVGGSMAVTDSQDTFAAAGGLGLAPIAGNMAVTDPADVAAVAGGVLVSGSMAVTDRPDTFAAVELPPCIVYELDTRNPDLTDVIGVAFLDRFDRFVKRDEDLYVVRLFLPATYCNTTAELTAAQYRSLTTDRRSALNNAPSGAGFVDTAHKSNA